MRLLVAEPLGHGLLALGSHWHSLRCSFNQQDIPFPEESCPSPVEQNGWSATRTHKAGEGSSSYDNIRSSEVENISFHAPSTVSYQPSDSAT